MVQPLLLEMTATFAHAKAAGLTIDEVVTDNGVSGLHSRLVERPGGRRQFDSCGRACGPLG
jgi:hypothetical protein